MLDLEYVCESVWVLMTLLGYIGGRLSDIHITYFHNIYNSYSYSAYVGVGGISVYLVNFGVCWIPNIIGGLNRDTEIPILFGFTWYELHL